MSTKRKARSTARNNRKQGYELDRKVWHRAMDAWHTTMAAWHEEQADRKRK